MIPFHHMQTSQSILLITTTPHASISQFTSIDITRTNPDHLVIASETSIGIDHIRQAKQYASSYPYAEPKKYIFILQFETATIEAQNAILKLLEEPPPYLTIVLTVSHTKAILDTVLSRCAIIHDNIPPKTFDTDNILTKLVQTDPAGRLCQLPAETKSKLEALNWCKKLLNEARNEYYSHPTNITCINLKLIDNCHAVLERNANPTIALSDCLLHLQNPNL